MDTVEPQSSWSSFWEIVNPTWMFRCKPSDFSGEGTSICPGIFWLLGLIGLLALHAGSIWFCLFLWQFGPGWGLASFVPVCLLWVVLVPADVKFRLQRPTRREREGFDNAVVNWFGLIYPIAQLVLILPAALAGLIWWVI